MKFALRSVARAAALAAISLTATANFAADVTVFVDGRSGPWDISANPAYPYGVTVGSTPDVHLSPTVVSAALGLSFAAGNSLTVQYVANGKSPLAGASGTVWGSGGDGVAWWIPSDPPCSGSPGCYTGVRTYLEQLLGVYADSAGVIVGMPFVVGSGPTTTVIPVGASRLLLGFNDGWYNDNGAGIDVRITEVVAVPEPEAYALMLAGLGMLGAIARRRRA